MKKLKLWFGAILLLAVALCGQTISAQKTAKSEIVKADDFVRVELSRVRLRPCTESPKQCALQILKASDDAVSEVPQSFEVYDLGKNKIVVLATYKVNGDDSVIGTRYRTEFNKNDGKYEFVELGKQFKCARGQKNWSKKLCQ